MIKVGKKLPRKYKRIFFSGEPNSGKTTAAIAWSKKSLWIDLDERIPDHLIHLCDFVEGVRHYNSLETKLKEALNSSTSEFKWDTIVLDTVTIAESMARTYSIDTDYAGDKHTYEDYSKGDKMRLPGHMGRILELMDKIAKTHSCDIVLICHTTIKPIKNPNGESYDKVVLDLSEKVRNRILQWADIGAFLYDDITLERVGLVKQAKDSAVKKISFVNTPKWDAKGPKEIPKDLVCDLDGKWVETVKQSIKRPTK